MKLPENPSKIVGKTYTGQKDDEGRPHGHGIMEYFTSGEKKYKYGGEDPGLPFCHHHSAIRNSFRS